jgi:hypothetical protein
MHSKNQTRTGAALWTVQIVLAVIFLLAGGAKLAMPVDELAKQGPFSAGFLRFIGLAEVAGALGLILPGLLRVRESLTPLAASGLVIIMIGASVSTVAIGQPAAAIVPVIVGALAVFVARRQWRRVRVA